MPDCKQKKTAFSYDFSEFNFWNLSIFLSNRLFYLFKKTGYLCPKNSVKETTIANCFKTVWSTEVSKEKLVDFALDEIPCPPQMECETFKSQVDIKAPF